MMQWESFYQHAYTRGMQKIRQIKGIACAFHSVMDGIIRITPEILDELFSEEPELKEAAKTGAEGHVPQEILTPADFIQGLFFSLRNGSALQRMIRSEETYIWALHRFGHGQLRLGGTSANMARSLAPLDLPVIIYANPLTEELAGLFGDFDNLKVITKSESGFSLQTPVVAAREKGIFAIHWILEYSADFEYHLDSLIVKPGRANRYIPSWNPRNNQFKMDAGFAEGFFTLAGSISHLLFSGFHILSETYPDGSTCYDVVKPLGDFLKRVCNEAPHIKIHLEMASIGSLAVRESVIQYVFPYIHSIGLNETELPVLCEGLRKQGSIPELSQKPAAWDYAGVIAALMRQTGVERVHFHNLGYYLCMEKNLWGTQEDTRDALLFAAIMAAARAKNGLFSSVNDIAPGLEQPFGENSFAILEETSRHLNQPSITEKGMGTMDEFYLTIIPSRFVKNPLFTVGLGDTISAGAFLTE